ncbi:MAG: glycosyltransferase [Anaerolineales bacterium]
MSKASVLHLAPSVGRASFGIGPVVLGLASAQQRLGYNASIWCEGDQAESNTLTDLYNLDSQSIRCFPFCGPKRLGYSPVMETAVLHSSYDVVHQHGIWTGVSHVTKRWRNHTECPTIIAPHGSLDAWALKRSGWKKHLALLAYERTNLNQASCLHALSGREAESFRAFDLHNPVAVIPNGISDSWLTSEGYQDSFRQRIGLNQEARVLLFLGRITPKKGLPFFLRAFESLYLCFPDWHVAIAGVDEFGHEAEVRSVAEQLGLESRIHFVGPLYDQDKRDAFAAAELFVLPSYSEGAPIVILEALGAGVPVLTTNASPWEELATHDCGWCTEISEDAIAQALGDALAKSPETLRQMGQHGQSLVAMNYTWSKIAEKTIMLYSWLLGQAEQPEFVVKE